MNVLFIGNSYTFNLSETIAELAAAHNVANDSFTDMQQRLQQGYENAAMHCKTYNILI